MSSSDERLMGSKQVKLLALFWPAEAIHENPKKIMDFGFCAKFSWIWL